MLRRRRTRFLLAAVGALAIGVALGAAALAAASPGVASPSVTPPTTVSLIVGDDVEGKPARAAATVDASTARCRDMVQCPPPADRSRFNRGDGFYRIPPWHDRNLSVEAKALDPWLDPFWPRFVQCMQSSGIGLGIHSPEQAKQGEIDRL